MNPTDETDPASIDSLFDLAGLHIVVTGAGSGLGRAIARGAAAFGASVALVDRSPDAMEETAALVGGGTVSIHLCDVSDPVAVSDTADDVLARHGRLDGLVNSAGIGIRHPAEEMPFADWERVLEVNLTGSFLWCQAAGRFMLDQGSGSIVNISSVAGQLGLVSGNANYAAAKGGLDALTRTLAAEWANRGVRVNAIAPTHFETPLVLDAIQADPKRGDYFLGNIPLGRLGRTVDIIGPAVFLLSEAAAMVTGHTLNVDGGHTVT